MHKTYGDLMDINFISPYIRFANRSTLRSPFHVMRRVLFDYELIFVQDGGCLLTVEGKPHRVQKGQVIFLRPGVAHSFRNLGEADFCQPHVHFDIQYNPNSKKTPISFRDYPALTEAERQLIQPDQLSRYPIPAVFTPDEPEKILALLLQTIEDYHSMTAAGFACRADFMVLLSRLLQQFPLPLDQDSIMMDKIQMVHDYLTANYLQPIALEDLSSLFYMNQYTLTRLFHKHYGAPTMQYYRELRLRYAIWRLKEKEVTVSSLASELHFSDIYAFSHFFKRATGLSPSEYKKNPDQYNPDRMK